MNALLTYLILFLLGRILCLSEGKQLSVRRLIWMTAIHLLGAMWLFNASAPGHLLLIGIVIIDYSLFLIERRLKRSSPAARSITMACGTTLISAVFLQCGMFHFRADELYGLNSQILTLPLAVLLCLKESNFLIRWFFQHYKLIEKVEAEKDAPKTDNGRIIGNLERLLLLLFLWEGAVLAATFIVAVKGLARFKKMEEHQAFAEYVIIGTFLSVLITLIIYKATSLLSL